MRKITAIMAALLVMAFAGTVFAATFHDVASDHWAYEAITKLEDLGLVEGFPDGTFKGNRTFTRYEMAMVVARLYDKMAGMENTADCADCAKLKDIEAIKAIIDKLTAEFKDELSALGVKIDELSSRVAAVEKDLNMLKNFLSTVKVSGTLRQRVIVPGTDMSPATIAGDAGILTALGNRGDLIVNTWIPAAMVQEPEAGYEMFYYLAIEGMAGDNIEVLVELDNYAVNTVAAPGNTRSPVIDQAYVAIDFSESASELDVLGVTSGFQYFAFGPYGLLVDNGFSAEPTVRLDMAKDRVSLTGIAGLMNQAAMNNVARDAYYVGRLGIDLDSVQVGINFLGSGLGLEKGWGADIDAELFTDVPWITGLTAELMQMSQDQNDLDLDNAPNDFDLTYLVGLDVYKTAQTAVKVSYGHMGVAPYYSGVDNDPFSEFDRNCTDLDGDGLNQCTASWESGAVIFPTNFEGFGVEASQKILEDTTLRFKAWKGDYIGGSERPAYAEVGVVKPINNNASFGIDYKQYGMKNILVNMVRGELLVNF